MLGFHTNPFLLQTADNVHLVNVLFQVAGKDVQIVFCNGKATVSEYLLERDHGTAHCSPFLCEGVAEAVNARLFQAPFVAVVPNGVIATASGQLLAIDGTEKPVLYPAATIL